MVTRLLGYTLLLAAFIVGGIVVYRDSHQSHVPLVFSPTQVLAATWISYKQTYVENGTFRTVDKQRDNVTTSEGQSYTMLRAVWMGDKPTFDGAWTWTQQNMFHTSDHLFAWLWGKKDNGTYGVLTVQSGENTASDADESIALALIFAYGRWQDSAYLSSARAILDDIWNKEVIVIRGTPYLTADNLEKTSLSQWAVINPSYLNPAAYKVFATVDPSHPWNALADSSYAMLEKSMQAPLDKTAAVQLPPNWVQIQKSTGAISALSASTMDTNFGFDAMRVPFNLELDWQWFGDPRDKTLLAKMSFLSTQWDANHALASIYSHDGSIVASAEAPALYGGAIGYFMQANTAQAKDVYQNKLIYLYDPGLNTWTNTLSYYDDNWVWFGIGLYNHQLPNLASDLTPGSFTH